MAPLRNDLHTLTGAYALDALDTAREVARFERHLNRCDSCTSEVRGFRETATRLGMAASRQPPPTLRTAVMADVARTRQVPAIEDRARHARPVRLTLLPRLATAGAAIGLAAAIALGVVVVNTQHELSQARHQLGQAHGQLGQAQRQLSQATTRPGFRTFARSGAVRSRRESVLEGRRFSRSYCALNRFRH